MPTPARRSATVTLKVLRSVKLGVVIGFSHENASAFGKAQHAAGGRCVAVQDDESNCEWTYALRPEAMREISVGDTLDASHVLDPPGYANGIPKDWPEWRPVERRTFWQHILEDQVED